MKTVRVLYISPNGFLGGAERFVLQTSIEHQRLNLIEVHILFLNNGDAVRLCQEAGVSATLLPFKLKLSNPISILKTLFFIRKLNIKLKANIIHSTMAYSQLISFCYWLIFEKVKLTWYQHGPVGGLLDQLAVWTKVDKIFFNSKFLQAEHNKIWGASLNKDKQMIAPLGIPTPPKAINFDVDLLKKELGLNSKFIFISPGRICEWKGQHNLILAVSMIKEKHPDQIKKIKCLIIGSPNSNSDKKYYSYLKELVEKFKLEENILFLSHTNNIHNFYRLADALIHTSTTPEPFGLVIAEAMKNECFVLGSDVGGVVDILHHGLTGWTFPASDLDADKKLHLKLLELIEALEDENSLEKILEMKERARKLIDNNYSIEKTTLNLESVYSDLLRATIK